VKRRPLRAAAARRRIAWPWVVASILLAPAAHGGHLTPAQRATLDLGAYATSTDAPDFTAPTLANRTVSLAALRGNVVLVNFWASWCLECRSEMPAFERLHRKFASRGLAIVGVNAREGTDVARRYASELRLTFPIALDPRGDVGARYGVIGLPTTFLIGRDGRAAALAIGPRPWDGAAAHAIVEALLSDHPASDGAR